MRTNNNDGNIDVVIDKAKPRNMGELYGLAEDSSDRHTDVDGNKRGGFAGIS